jgi:ribosomal protein S18 acetylase RimI-like enzyme
MQEITLATRNNSDELSAFHANEWGDIFTAIENQQRELFLIRKNAQISGYVTLNYQPKYPLYRRLNIPEIQDLYISPEFRRQGYASLLLDHCETTAQKRGATEIGISVSVGAEFGVAQQLYIARGYNVDGNGVTYNREAIKRGGSRPVDENLCLMMLKALDVFI